MGTVSLGGNVKRDRELHEEVSNRFSSEEIREGGIRGMRVRTLIKLGQKKKQRMILKERDHHRTRAYS